MTLDDSPGGPDVEQLVWLLAVDAAGVGVFDWDLTTGALRWDDRLLSVFGVHRREFGGTIEAFNALLHPDDVPRVSAALEHAIATCGDYAAEYRVVTPRGEVRWVAARGRAVTGESGVAVRVIGAAYDTTDAVDADARVSRVLESMPTAFFHIGRDWRFSFLNPEAERLLQRPRRELVGQDLWASFPAAVDSEFETHYRAAMDSGRPVSFDAYYPEPLDAWYEVRAWPNPDGLGVYFNDVTERHVAQQRMLALAVRDELVSRVAVELAGTLDPREALRRLSRLLVPRFGVTAAAALVDATALDGKYAVVQQVGAWRHVADTDEVRRREGLTSVQFFPRDVVAGLEDPAVTVVTDPALCAAVMGEALPVDAKDLVALPLRGRDQLVGVVVVAAGDPRGFAQEDLDTLVAVTSGAGLAIDNARLFAAQRDLAEGLQRSLLTQAPHPEGLEVAVCYEAAAHSAQVGGDWYDAFVLESGDTVLVVGDVVGHDTEAAAAMGQLRNLLRGIAVHGEEDPADLLRGVDRVLHRLGSETTATALVARISGEPDAAGDRQVRWSSAGHPPPALIGADGGCQVLESGSHDLLIGLDPQAERTESVATLPHGAVLLLFTDGLVERRGEDLDVGLARLCSGAGELGAPPSEGLSWWCDELVVSMVGEQREDDVALVAVRAGDPVEPEVPDTDVLSVLLPADPASVARSRAAVRAALAEAGTLVLGHDGGARNVEDDAVLAVSELVTNALVHAGTAVLLRVAAGPRGVRVEVQDGSAHSPVPRRHSLTSGTGRGLRLVDSSVDRWDVTRHRDGKSVWFQIGSPPDARPTEDEPPAAAEPTRRVVLRDVPVLVHWAWQEHAASLLREHLLQALEEEPGALESHAAASDALDLLREWVPAPVEGETWPGAADVTVDLPERSLHSFVVLGRLLDETTLQAREGRLLAAPTQPEIEQLHTWLCTEVAEQVAGRDEPRPWLSPAAGPRD